MRQRLIMLSALAMTLCASVMALVNLRPGFDYPFDAADAVDALARLDFGRFFADQPLMGSFSLYVRAPMSALAGGSPIELRYLLGCLPCVGAVAYLMSVLTAHMRATGRPRWQRLAVVVVGTGSPMMIKAIHWGHPEELLCGALAVGAILAAPRHPGRSAVLLGCALATKQWAVLAVAPALMAVPATQRRRFAATAALVAGVLIAPMVIGDPDRFWLVQRAAGSSDPVGVLQHRPLGALTFVMPPSVWSILGAGQSVDGHRVLLFDTGAAGLAHTAILLICGSLTALVVTRRPAPVPVTHALRLMALCFAVRCGLDPMDLDYYHAPLLMALAAIAAHGGAADVRVGLSAAAGLSLTFIQPAEGIADLMLHPTPKWGLSVLTLAWLVLTLGRALADRPRHDRRRRPAAGGQLDTGLAVGGAPRSGGVGR